MALIRQLKTFEDVVAAMGGNAGVRRLIGATPQQLSNWRGRGHFPERTFLTFREALAARGASATPALWRIDEPADARRPRRRNGGGK